MPAKHLSIARGSLLAIIALFAGACAAADSSNAGSPTRVKWQCTEQPATLVVVNAKGELASETRAAKNPDPVPLHAIKIAPTASGPGMPARVISTDQDLLAPAATWLPGNSVTSDNGALRLDLADRHAFLASNQFGNQTLFRRFDCATAGKEAPVHYRCGADFDLWISFRAAGDDAQESDSSKQATSNDSAIIQYPGGQIALPRARSGSGARYARADSSLWIKGDAARFSLAGGEEHRCQIDD